MVNKKLKLISRCVTCALIVIVAMASGKSVKASDNGSGKALSANTGSGIQPLDVYEYSFTLRTHGEYGEQFDVSSMRKKDSTSNMYVSGYGGGPHPVEIWAVGYYDEGYFPYSECIDCSGFRSYNFYPDSRLSIYNEIRQNYCSYGGVACQALNDEATCIMGGFNPDLGDTLF